MKARILATLMVAVSAGLAGCNLAASSDQTQVTLSLPLLDCAALQNPALGGSRIEGTFIAVAGAEFPPLTELRRETNPCSDQEPNERALAALNVRVPQGSKRALALAIVGRPLPLVGLTLPDSVDVRGINISTREPRPIFFAGGKLLEGDVLGQTEPSIALTLEPFVNMLGSVQRGPRGEGVQATIDFILPEVGGCLTTVDTADDPAIKRVYKMTTNRSGAFFATVPYRSTETNCKNDESHGNEIFALVEGAGGAALYVPGRAITPGQGLEPGVLLRDTTIYLRDRGDAAPSLVTSVTYVPTAGRVELHVAGFGVPQTVNGRAALEVQKLPGGASQTIEFEASEPVVLGNGGLFGPLPSYQRAHLFGERKPFSMKLSTSQGFDVGTYRITLPEGTPFTFRVAGQQ